jgi:predicted DNA-binding protein (MmcQ/YjbR family)
MDEVGRLRQRLSDFANALPGDPSGEAGLSVKLADSHDEAMATPGAKPTGYGLGRAGWVSVPLDGEHDPPAEVIEGWIVESYRRVAPKRLAAQLLADRPTPGVHPD